LDYSEFKCRWIEPVSLWNIADEARIKYWPEASLPIDAEGIIEFRLKLDIEPIKNLLSAIDIDAYLKRDLSGIVVDYDCYMNDKFANRMRFSFAHELGHFFLHKELYLKFGVISPEDWKDFILNVPENEYRSFEWQANEFAGRLLVPYQELEAEMEKVGEILEENNLRTFLSKDPDAVLSRISPMLCKPFGISTEVLEKRVKREGLWPPDVK
jgi:Zn-dependent peptidase ImmA (M78 family)